MSGTQALVRLPMLQHQRGRSRTSPAVCEGCGDCSVQSNCLSIEPLATPLGVKRKINQSSCNKDFSCVKGFCPSFVTAEGATMRKPATAAAGSDLSAAIAALPQPAPDALDAPCSIVVTGVAGPASSPSAACSAWPPTSSARA
jgi:indolepyruvate ferredoxin oxidoreductase